MKITPQTFSHNDLVEHIAKFTGFTKVDVRDCLYGLYDVITDELIKKNNIKIHKFGMIKLIKKNKKHNIDFKVFKDFNKKMKNCELKYKLMDINNLKIE
jgi:nucleoid DNA-binding protein